MAAKLVLAHLFFVILSIQAHDATTRTPGQWQTWSGIACSPSNVFFPSTIEEVQKIIKEALQSRLPVRFYGSGHSINDLVCTYGYIVNTDSFSKILEVNKERMTVRVEGGIKLKKLYKELAKHNLALANQGYIKEQSIAGALATGTHGTGKTGTLSDFVMSMEIIDSRGVYHVISQKTDPELLAAARINLGALGFVYAVTLQCEPLFVLAHERVLLSWNTIFNNHEQYYHDNDYYMIMAHPLSDKALVYTWNRTNEKPTNNFFIRLTERLLTNELTNYLTLKAAHVAPGLTNDFIEHFFKAMEQKTHREYSYKTLSPIKTPMTVEHYIEEEIAIDAVHFKEAVQAIIQLYDRFHEKGFELVGFMTCRFVKGSRKALLSPTYDRDSVYISLITLNTQPYCAEFYREFEHLMNAYGPARPHWGKYNTLDVKETRELYGANIDAFNAVREKFDHYRIFTNQYVQDRLGL